MTEYDNNWVMHPTLQCGLKCATVLSDTEVHFLVPDDHIPDMTGAIKLAKAVLPSALIIYVEDKPCISRTVYVRPCLTGKWRRAV